MKEKISYVLSGYFSSVTDFDKRNIRCCSEEIEALLPKPISVKECGLPKERGRYYVWTADYSNEVWFDGEVFQNGKDYMDYKFFTPKVKYYLRNTELLKLLPKGE